MIFVVGSKSSGGGPTAADAILTVTAPAGSTVTATKGGTTLTPTMWVQAADATLDCALFVIAPAQFDSVNPWTVTATLGTDTASASVTVTTNAQYDVELAYHYYLYNRGNQFVDRTGGWTATRDSASVFLTDRIHLWGGTYPVFGTVNKAQRLTFTTLVMVVENAVLDGWAGLQAGWANRNNTLDSGSVYFEVHSSGLATVDLTTAPSSNYVCGYVYTNNQSCDITQIWLE